MNFYVGNDYDRDMAKINQDSVTQEWWKLTGPMQEPLETCKEGERWASMDEIFHWSGKNEPHEKTGRMAFATRIDGCQQTVTSKPVALML